MNTPFRARGAARHLLLLAAAGLVAAGAGLYIGMQRFSADAGPTAGASADTMASLKPQMGTVRLIVPARELPAWSLRLSDGGVATPATLQGRWTLVFLGFTHCADVCPTTLAELAKAQKDWAALPLAHRPRLLFVTADPERDTPKIVGDYVHYFHPETLAASPSLEQLAAFAKSLGLVYMKVPGANGDYEIDHSATLVLLDPQGRQAGLVSPPLDARKISDDLRLLAERAP
jgi:protein SCO1/2